MIKETNAQYCVDGIIFSLTLYSDACHSAYVQDSKEANYFLCKFDYYYVKTMTKVFTTADSDIGFY